MNSYARIHGHHNRRLVCALAFAVALGMIAGRLPLAAVGLVLGICVLAVVMANVTAGLMVFTVVAFLEFLPTAAGAPSVAKLVGLSLLIGWVGVAVFGPAEYRHRVDITAGNPFLIILLALFLAWVLFSTLWALDPAVSRSVFFSDILLLMLFPIVYAAIRTLHHVVWLYGVFIAGGLASATIGLLQPGSADVGDRLSGAGLNPNILGALLAAGVVLSATLAALPGLSSAARLTALLASGACLFAVLLTGSRGALVGLFAALLAAPFLCGPRRRASALALVVGASMAIFVWIVALAPQDIAQRLLHPGSGTGRVDIWTIALRMVRDNPVTGVGAGNFPIASVHYLLQPGIIDRADFIIDKPKVTHNIYLQVLSELGFIGLTLYLAIIVVSFACAVQAARSFRRQGNIRGELLARGLTIALVSLLAAYFFSSALNSKQLYLLLAVGPALRHMARRSEATSQLDP